MLLVPHEAQAAEQLAGQGQGHSSAAEGDVIAHARGGEQPVRPALTVLDAAQARPPARRCHPQRGAVLLWE